MRLDERFYIGPDNGLFSLVFERSRSTEVREISNPTLFLPEPHPTFHGRDVFAPVAAHLSLGIAFDSVGPVSRRSRDIIYTGACANRERH